MVNGHHWWSKFPSAKQAMIRVLFKKMLDEKAFRERRRITLSEVVEQTGISRTTLTRISNLPGYNVNTEAINALCKYLECGPCELLTYVPDDE